MLLVKDGMFGELYDKDNKFLGLNRLTVQKIIKLVDPGLLDPNDEQRAFRHIPPEQPRRRPTAILATMPALMFPA